jgi:hypothetical protein
LGLLFPIYGKLKKVPNHQPDKLYTFLYPIHSVPKKKMINGKNIINSIHKSDMMGLGGPKKCGKPMVPPGKMICQGTDPVVRNCLGLPPSPARGLGGAGKTTTVVTGV